MADMNAAMGMKPWSKVDFLLMFAMWAVMMVGMMVPTAIRSVLIFVRSRCAGGRTGSVVRIWLLVHLAGYVLIWTFFSAAATVLQWILDQAALLSPMMVSSSAFLGAFLLISAGAWQFSPVKDACLRHCQSPVMYLATHYRPGVSGALRPRYSTWFVLFGLLLASHGFVVRGRCNEPAVDRGNYGICSN